MREFNSDAGFERSAALAYKFLISLVPLLAVALALFVAFAPLQDISEKVEGFLFDAVLPPQRVTVDTDPVPVPAPADAEAPALPELPGDEPDTTEETETEDEKGQILSSSEMREYLSGIIRQLQTSNREVGLIGTLFLFVTTLSLFNTIEVSFNRVWKVKKRRPPVRKFQAFWAIVSLGPLLLGASLFLTGQLAEHGFWGSLADSSIAKFVRVLVPFFCSFIAIYLVYQFVPYTRVNVTAALIGAVVGAVLWELGKQGFRLYLTQAVSFERIYGALGTLPVLLLWLYLSWIVVLYGAEVAYVWQHLEAVRHDRVRSRHLLGSQLPVGLALLAEIGRRFRISDQPPRLPELIEACGCTEIEARHCLQALHSGGLIHRAEGGRFLLGRPAENIRLLEIARALGEDSRNLERSLEPGPASPEALIEAWRRRDAVLGAERLSEVISQAEVPVEPTAAK